MLCTRWKNLRGWIRGYLLWLERVWKPRGLPWPALHLDLTPPPIPTCHLPVSPLPSVVPSSRHRTTFWPGQVIGIWVTAVTVLAWQWVTGQSQKQGLCYLPPQHPSLSLLRSDYCQEDWKPLCDSLKDPGSNCLFSDPGGVKQSTKSFLHPFLKNPQPVQTHLS